MPFCIPILVIKAELFSRRMNTDPKTSIAVPVVGHASVKDNHCLYMSLRDHPSLWTPRVCSCYKTLRGVRSPGMYIVEKLLLVSVLLRRPILPQDFGNKNGVFLAL